MILDAKRSQFLLIDVQERLLPAMHDHENILVKCEKLLQVAIQCAVPVTFSEQYPAGIGPTVTSLKDLASGHAQVFEKIYFSCARDDKLRSHLDGLCNNGRDQVVIAGIESHVCVLQTAIDLKIAGYHVAVVADAISSRARTSVDMALQRMSQAGIVPLTFEMLLFEWLEKAGSAEFKALLKLIK